MNDGDRLPGDGSCGGGDGDHQVLRQMLGAFLLGGLDGNDRARLEAHLRVCPGCARELTDLSPVPGLLARVRSEDLDLAEDPPPRPDDVALRRMLSRRRRRRTARVAAGLLAAAACVTVGLAVGRASAPAPSASSLPADAVVELVAPTGSAASGSAALVTKPWGTELHLSLTRMPARGPFRLEAEDSAGSVEIAATWGTTTRRAALVVGASSRPPDQLRGLRVVGPDGVVLSAEAG